MINLRNTHARPHPELRASLVIASARGLVKTYGGGVTAVHALAGVDVAFARGERTAIMGASGSGKATVLHCLAGLDTPPAGTVGVAGPGAGALLPRRRGVGGYLPRRVRRTGRVDSRLGVFAGVCIMGPLGFQKYANHVRFYQPLDAAGLTSIGALLKGELTAGQRVVSPGRGGQWQVGWWVEARCCHGVGQRVGPIADPPLGVTARSAQHGVLNQVPPALTRIIIAPTAPDDGRWTMDYSLRIAYCVLRIA